MSWRNPQHDLEHHQERDWCEHARRGPERCSFLELGCRLLAANSMTQRHNADIYGLMQCLDQRPYQTTLDDPPLG